MKWLVFNNNHVKTHEEKNRIFKQNERNVFAKLVIFKVENLQFFAAHFGVPTNLQSTKLQLVKYILSLVSVIFKTNCGLHNLQVLHKNECENKLKANLVVCEQKP